MIIRGVYKPLALMYFSSSFKNFQKKSPKAFYLRRESVTGSEEVEATTTTSGGGAIIIKTLVISATACLVSILLLLSLGYAVYKVSFTRSRRLVTTTSITNTVSSFEPKANH
jgi:ABC-type glycerol-3-phosphate transport system permease component